METMIEGQVHITLPARGVALAWVNVFNATSQEEDRPVLYRTVCIEVFDTGVQLIACDGSALFRAWVPTDAGDGWPMDMERPDRTIVVMDPDGFGIGFMKSLLRVTGEDGHAFEELTLTTAPYDQEAELPLGEAFQTERLTLRACGQRIDLRLFDGAYAGWRHLNLGITPAERVDGMTVAGRLLAMLGKLKGCGAVDLEFHGEAKSIAFVAHGDAEVRGLIMPMRRGKSERRDEEE